MQNITSMEISALSDGIDLSPLFGRRKSHRFKNFIDNESDNLFERFNAHLTPLLSYRTKEIDFINEGHVCLERGIVLKSAKLSKVMKHCEKILCFVATIGDGVEQESVRLTDEGSLFDAYILESMGSMAVESMVESFCKDMETKYNARGKGITLRLSPGYCDWSITEQKKLFRIIDATRINVTLTDACLMHPRKSISGVFGIYAHDGDSPASSYNPCSDCNKKDCTARRV